MKFLMPVFLVLFLWACAGREGDLLITPEDKVDIASAVQSETILFASRDSLALYDLFLDDVVTQSVWNNADGSFTYKLGKSEILKGYSAVFRVRPQKIQLPEITRTQWIFKKLNQDWVWVNFVQVYKQTNGNLHRTFESRLLKKVGSKWKIAVINAWNDFAIEKN